MFAKGVPFVAGREKISPSFALRATEGILRLPAVGEEWRKGWEPSQSLRYAHSLGVPRTALAPWLQRVFAGH